MKTTTVKERSAFFRKVRAEFRKSLRAGSGGVQTDKLKVRLISMLESDTQISLRYFLVGATPIFVKLLGLNFDSTLQSSPPLRRAMFHADLDSPKVRYASARSKRGSYFISADFQKNTPTSSDDDSGPASKVPTPKKVAGITGDEMLDIILDLPSRI